MSWDELVTSALVGTARRPPARPAAPPGSALAGVLGGIGGEDTEGTLLRAGAVLGLYRQAGAQLTVDGGPLPVPSPPEARPYCSRAAAERLGPILAGPFRPLLGEWLALARGAGLIVPPDRLPSLLQAGSTEPGLRASIVEVLGERGRWLAGLNPAWGWAVGGGGAEDDTSTWATGSRDARRLLLARLRAANPDAARELLASTWATETPEDRAAFLGSLRTGLTMEDEPFLEAALDDRRKEVRHAAAELLWRLPGSRLAARMAKRARPLVRVTGIRFPAAVDKAMERDGVVAKPPVGVGERAWWLHQLVAAAPLAIWPVALGASPAHLVERAGPPVRYAWAVAAHRQQDEEWALALLEAGDVDEPALVRAVPHERAVAIVAERVAELGVSDALGLLEHCPVPWGPALSRAVVEHLAEAVREQGRLDAAAAAIRSAMPLLAARIDPSVAPGATVALAEPASRWSDVVGWFGDLLAFRAEMHQELPR